MSPGLVPVCLNCRQFGCMHFPGILMTNTRPSLAPRQNFLSLENTTDFHSASFNQLWLDIIGVTNGNGLQSVEYALQLRYRKALFQLQFLRKAACSGNPCFLSTKDVATVAEWYRYRTVACFVTGSSPVPLKTRRVGQRCTLNLSRAETSSRWCGVVVRRGGASSGVVHVT
ncbi:uncharacterized protein TNCV_2371581 [Trichonephila clavipes]|nr:uncharacterized protein TNCV_2371581 [Trichonephila clavipes]